MLYYLKSHYINGTSFLIPDVFDFRLEKAGFMSSLPYLVMAIIMQFSGHLADYLRNSDILTTTQVIF